MNKADLERYSRQIAVAEIGINGQKKLSASSVFIVGIGGLGGLVAASLAGTGIGKIAFADSGIVEISNLHRQSLYRQQDIGLPKARVAKKTLSAINSSIKIEANEKNLEEKDMPSIFADFSCIVDCSDNFKTRAAINKVCVKMHKPCIYGAVYGFEGQAALFANDGKEPCLECVFPNINNCQDTKCSEHGIIAPVVNFISSIQANEVIKLLIGLPTLKSKMLMADLLNNSFETVNLKKRANCHVCLE